MVRLKAYLEKLIERIGSSFQFQNGSIKRFFVNYILIVFLLFQFQNGSIKS